MVCKPVMVVDDEEGIRETVALALELEGFASVLARNGADALAKLATHTPCVILLDLMMPVMDGLEFMRRTESLPVIADIPIVLVTAFAKDAAASRARCIVNKPFSLDELVATVKQYCGQTPAYHA